MNNVNRVIKPNLIRAAGAAFLAASITGAYAQAPENSESSAMTLEEIIVSARKRDESLQDTPVVITALSAKTIGDFGIESVEDIADFTPGLMSVQQEAQSGGVLRLRGIGSGVSNPIIDQAVSLVVDDMQIGTLQIQRSAMLDMQSVQVYKGPQALFFGKNSPGGVVAIRTADPGEEFEAQIKTGYEFEAKERFIQGVVSGPFSDTVAGRLVVRYSESDGYYDIETGPFDSSFGDQGPESEQIFARGTLLFEPSDDLTIRTKLTYSDLEAQGGFNIQRFYCPLGAPQNSPNFNCEADNTVQMGDIPQAAIDIFDAEGMTGVSATGNMENDQFLLTVGVDYSLSDELTLTSVTGYYDTFTFSPANAAYATIPAFLVAGLEFDYQQFSQELRLSSSFDSPVNFGAGLFYEQKEQSSNTIGAADIAGLLGSPVPVWINALQSKYDQDTEAYSAFVDITWDITEDLELSGGARYSYEEKEFNGLIGAALGKDDDNWSDVSPQVTLSWSPSEEWLFFASYREGFKSGGYDGSPQAQLGTYDQEEVNGFEVGAKGSLLDNTLQVNAAIYTYDYTDLQLTAFDATTNSASTFNAGDSEITGVELDFVWLTPISGLQARGGIAYTDSEMSDVLVDCYAGQSVAQGCDQNFNPAAAPFGPFGPFGGFESQNIDGKPLPFAAEIVGNIGLSYEADFDNLVLGLSLDALYSDEYEPDTFFAPGTTQDSYMKVNAAIRLSSADDTWSASLVGRNLTDEYQVYSVAAAPSAPGVGTGTDGTVGPIIPGDFIGHVGIGRTYSIELEYSF